MDTQHPWPAPVASNPAIPSAEQRAGASADPGQAFGQPRRNPLKRVGSGIAVVAAAIFKFFAQIKGLLLLAPKLKVLTLAGSALVSVAAYALFWGWQFAVGFVALLFVHEMGHVLQLRREGLRSSAPFFIPFLGAMIKADLGKGNALIEAKVGLAGPVLGTLGAAACVPIYLATNNKLFLALAYVGFLLNLFNLLPMLPLDGGRAMAAVSPWVWLVGFAALIPIAFLLHGPFVFVIVVLGGMETWRRWRARRSGSLEQAAYYRVAGRHRVMVAATYLGLVAVLAVGMELTYVARTIS